MILKSFCIGLAVCMASVSTAQAQTVFDVKLAGAKLGTLTYAATGTTERMNTTLSNTPMGVFNGTMEAVSKLGGGVQRFTAKTGAERKSRTVVVTHKAGRVVETSVEPAIQITPLSNPARVPAGTIDPVQAIGKMVNAPDCPAKMTIYDGRRAVTLTPKEAAIKDGVQICKMSYRVVAGPPHLSPINVSKARMTLRYSASGAPRKLMQIDVSHGIFKVRLSRR